MYQRVRNVSFLENFANVINELSLEKGRGMSLEFNIQQLCAKLLNEVTCQSKLFLLAYFYIYL